MPEGGLCGRIVGHHEETQRDHIIDFYDIEVLKPIRGTLKPGNVVSVRMPEPRGVRHCAASVRSHPFVGQRVVALLSGPHSFHNLLREFGDSMVDDHNDAVVLQAGLLKPKRWLERETRHGVNADVVVPPLPRWMLPTSKPVQEPYEIPDFDTIVDIMRAAPPCDANPIGR